MKNYEKKYISLKKFINEIMLLYLYLLESKQNKTTQKLTVVLHFCSKQKKLRSSFCRTMTHKNGIYHIVTHFSQKITTHGSAAFSDFNGISVTFNCHIKSLMKKYIIEKVGTCHCRNIEFPCNNLLWP